MEEARLARWGRGAAAVVLLFTVVDLLNVKTAPWTSLCLAVLGLAILVQSGHPNRPRVWLGRTLAVAVAAFGIVVLAEHFASKSFGPTPRTAASILYLSAGVLLMRIDRRRTGWLWGLSLLAALATPITTVVGHTFKAVAAVNMPESTGQGISTAVGVLLLVTATVMARPDRNPVAWLVKRPDRWALLRLVGILGGLPFLVGLTRLPLLAVGLGDEAAWILSTTIATVVVGAAVFYLSQREQGLLIERETLSRQRAEAEMRYRIIADNAVDVILHLNGGRVEWVSPSVETAFGAPPEHWIGTDIGHNIDPDDYERVMATLAGVGSGEPIQTRFRVHTADGGYHWVDGHAKPYVDAEGNTNGLIAALRIIDEQVEAEQKLDRLARFDALTGLPNRAEAISRLDAALEEPRTPGSCVGILFCDVDHFKTINDTLGHAAGDAVLSTLAARIRQGVRQGDTVGRMGGDEILVVLPGLRSLDDATRIAEEIRCRAAEPIHHAGEAIEATLSIGATTASPGESAGMVMARADEAMYQAKQARRNMVVRI